MIRISAGIVAETLLFLNTISNMGCSHIKETNLLDISYGLNNNLSIDFAKQNGWIEIDSEQIIMTDRGKRYIAEYRESGLSKRFWRNVLKDYIKEIEPAWSKRIPYGRQEAYLFMTSDERRCFNYAELMCNTDKDTVEWWDQINNWLRNLNDMPLLETGRLGEELTIEYEKNRVRKAPIWKAIETNLAGYDILSIREHDCTEKLLIEVKTSAIEYENAKMIITRNEWDVAYNTPDGTYLFYSWILLPTKKLAILSPDDIKPHIPIETGCGRWKEVEVMCKSFPQEKWREIMN